MNSLWPHKLFPFKTKKFTSQESREMWKSLWSQTLSALCLVRKLQSPSDTSNIRQVTHRLLRYLFSVLPWFIFLWGLVNTAQMFQCFFNRKCSVKPPGWTTRESDGRGDKKVKARGDIIGLHILDKYTVWRTALSASVDTVWQPFNSNTALKHARAIRWTPSCPAVTFKHTIFHVEARLANVCWNHISAVVKLAVISQQGRGIF